MVILNFLSLNEIENKIKKRLKRKIASELMHLVMKIVWFIQHMCQIKNSRIAWICC